jgi:hypothetical protein
MAGAFSRRARTPSDDWGSPYTMAATAPVTMYSSPRRLNGPMNSPRRSGAAARGQVLASAVFCHPGRGLACAGSRSRAVPGAPDGSNHPADRSFRRVAVAMLDARDGLQRELRTEGHIRPG